VLQFNKLPTGLAKPALRTLSKAGVRTLEDLSKMTQAEVVGLHGMGPKALERIQLALTETNLSFKSDSE